MLIRLMDRESPDSGPVIMAVAEDDISFRKGAPMENMVAEYLMKAGVARYHYMSRKEPGRMELNFVAELGSDITAIEVKSRKSRDAPSLSKTIGDPRFGRRVKLDRTDVFVDEGGIEHYPLFAVTFINGMKETPPTSG